MGMVRRQRVVGALVAACFAVGCAGGPAGTKRPASASRPTPRASAGPSTSPAGPTAVRPLPLEAARRTLGVGLVAQVLVGQAKLISDHGGGLIGNNGGALISNNTGNLISDHGGGLISNNGGALISNNGGALVSNNGGAFRLAQSDPGASGARGENFLVDAQVEFLDAERRLLVDAKGEPVQATTDASGAFRFTGRLPDENLIARVRLYNGGQLMAMLPRALDGGERRLDLDTASSLGAAFVLSRYVESTPSGKRQGVFNRLPGAEARALGQELEVARALLGRQTPGYEPEAMAQLTGSLEAQSAPVKERLARIKAILLAGQAELGDGLPANTVALSWPSGAVAIGDELQLVEYLDGRLRVVGADGRIRSRALKLATGLSRGSADALGALPDGGLLVVDRLGNRVLRVAPDGATAVALGTGSRGQSLGAGQPLAAELDGPKCVVCLPDGSWLVAEDPGDLGVKGRILKVGADGVLSEVPLDPAMRDKSPHWMGLAAWPDGRMAAFNKADGQLWWRDAAGAWAAHSGLKGAKTRSGDRAYLLAMPDGSAMLSLESGNQLLRVRPGVAGFEHLAGEGPGGYAGEGVPPLQARFNAPRACALDGQGRVLIADQGNGLLRRYDPAQPQKPVELVAGTFALQQVGDALALPINGPGGMVIDPQGRVVVSESFAGVIKRLEGDRLSVVAGGVRGFADGPREQARFNGPSGLALAPDGSLYVCDTENQAIRRVAPDGTVSTVAGVKGALVNGDHEGDRGIPRVRVGSPLQLKMRRPLGAAIAPTGELYWSDNENHQVWRLRQDGQAELVLGLVGQGPPGQEKPSYGAQIAPDGKASGTQLNLPTGLAFDAQGALFVCDSANLRVLRLFPPTPEGQVEVFAGAPVAVALPRVTRNEVEDPAGTPKLEALLLGPASLAVLPDGRMLVSEAGTDYLSSMAGSAGLPNLILNHVPSRIRLIDAQGGVSVVAGPGGQVLAATEGDDVLGGALAIAIDGQGRLVVADSMRNQLKLVPAGAF